MLTSFYKHPVEITLNSLITSAITFPLLGCDTKAAAIYVVLITVAEYFYHWNIRTPRWLGWIVQRPESHRVHHQRNRHTMNYADLPILDWLFGTFNNPSASVSKCGFDPVRESRFTEMLAFRDVHQKTAPSASERSERSTLAFPTCFGCSKRWICHATKTEPAQ
jgi:sterol desaturase/sphingolipid hydroxylase (fatty acid hydroxylase superfamily)